ncbi:Metallo-dependent phosphatase-like protein [Ephemerocybe angulata]|uniref:Metallo-dependent phosphatase-like protein n=1 Tax=Ephemerocybe angulata TaxID=980116 RepID=A0A8H6IGB6_9AGAR|nr:Metallo-dependent phosphatase-like protein [Tulosesus angulatus]
MVVKTHIEYDSVDSIPHPGAGWTRFVCISDTHSRREPLPFGDVLLHSGDLSAWGYPHQVKAVISWLKEEPHPVKIIVAGNHDLCLDARLPIEAHVDETPESLESIREYVRSQEVKNAGLNYLEHESMEFTTEGGRSWKVYGSPAAPHYAGGAFQYKNEAAAKELYNRIPLDTEILLTHTPPFEVLDLTRKGKNAGCRFLGERLEMLHSCRLHVFGHIHEARGALILKNEDNNERVAVNAAIAHRGSKPIIVDISH